ncbi:hypothetical protein ACFVYD_30380 [Streptomyces sp. NPDC058301]|uniref:hypothetical protein n=1 Tax=Streptomyces sp. NPDC058301 TaxID=3346436 RepID=UPI0036E522AB
MTPAKLPVVGTTWYRRGPRYWLRRAGVGFVGLLTAVLVCAAACALFDGLVSGLPDGWRKAGYVVEGAAGVAGLAWGWVRGRRQIRERLANPPTPEQSWARQREARRGAASGVSSRGLMLLMLPLLPAVMAWWLGAMCAATFVWELPSEVGARRALQ